MNCKDQIPKHDNNDLPIEVRDAITDEAIRVSKLFDGSAARHVLIIGGAGYIGGALTSGLLHRGMRVRALDQLTYEHGSVISGFLLDQNYSFIRGDMGNKADLEAALDGITDVVILAGLVGDPITKKFPDEAHDINDLGIKTCIDHLNGRSLNKVIFVSTCSNYGLIEENVLADENFELSPLSLYAKSKVAAEQYLLSLKGKTDYHPTILRFATAFGLAPRMRFDLTVNEFTREVAAGNELVVYDAHTWRPYCHVCDFSWLIGRVLEFPVEKVCFEVFNAGGDENNHTKQSIVDLILARIPGAKVSYKANSSDPRNYRVNFKKVRSILHFEPAYSIADGVDEILWAMGSGLLEDVEARSNFYGNYALTGLEKADEAHTPVLEVVS
jgi:nucleoside-diphosphate-sugar epimerase